MYSNNELTDSFPLTITFNKDCICRSGTVDDDPDEYRKVFGETWDRINLDRFVNESGENIVTLDTLKYYLEQPVFVYYLPAFMLIEQVHYDAFGLTNLAYEFSKNPYDEDNPLFLLTIEQKKAVAKFLVNLKETFKLEDSELTPALDLYWGQFIEGFDFTGVTSWIEPWYRV